MKTCPNCRNQITDESLYCPVCGTNVGVIPQYQPPQQSSTTYQVEYTQPTAVPEPIPYIDPYDHTDEFEEADMAENKIFAMLAYLLGPLGVIIALLAAPTSKYTAFHTRQAVMLTVAEILGILALTVVSYILWMIRLRVFMLFVIGVSLIGVVLLHVVTFLQVCKGKSKEVFFVRKLSFLR